MSATNPGRRLSWSVMAGFTVGLFWTAVPERGFAAEALVAVAANFVEIMRRLETEFEGASGHDLTVVSGSSGKLYAQIVQGAPFDVYLAADQQRPRLLEEEGFAVKGSRFTYAIGRLVLWSRDRELVRQGGADTLRAANFRKLAIANPALAPYGVAAQETLEALGLLGQLRTRLVIGENIGQAFAMAHTGNAELAFVAMSFALHSAGDDGAGFFWEVPQDYYSPVRQDAVLLSRATANPAARELIRWLKAEPAREMIEDSGYWVN